MEAKRSRKELVKRYAVLTAGLYLMALSIRLSVSTAMGTSPISTIPNVMSCYFTQVSLGVHMFIWNMTLLLAVFTGFVVKFFQDKLGNAVDRFLEK